MSSASLSYPEQIRNPVLRGTTLLIPRGTAVRHRGQLRPAGRSHRVAVRMCSPGHLVTYTDERWGRGTVVLPTITWAGTGGYWSDAQVTPELLAANELPELVLPEVDERLVDVLPSLDEGYTDRWRLETER